MSPLILDWHQIVSLLGDIDVVETIASGFAADARGEAVIPPVGEMKFADPPGDVHIKYGYLDSGSHYVVKIASGFYNNPKLGISSSQGLMLLFDQKTGELAAVLLDDGNLTDIRTAAAGAVAARHLAPERISTIGIVGTGIQARQQTHYLRTITDCRKVMVWGRTDKHRDRCLADISELGFETSAADSVEDLCARCNLIVTTTPATEALVNSDWIAPGTHITAVGSDTPGKQELDPRILLTADLVVADRLKQCLERGEIASALDCGGFDPDSVVELGHVVSGGVPGRTSDGQITVADLTGVAIQDLQIALAVYHKARTLDEV